ncbi:MAG: CRTAC1 family protein [Myxococcota bacterium]
MKIHHAGAFALITAGLALPTTATAQHGHGPCIDHGPEFEDASALLDWERVNDPYTAHLGGAAWLDYDADGDLDLFIPNSPGGDNALFRNDQGSFVDVAAQAGITGEGSGFTGATAGDIDNDGCTDLFLTGAGGFIGVGLPSRLYMNNCDGTFTNTTAGSGIDAEHLALMAAFGDIDNDGYVDLYVASPGNLINGYLTEQKLYHNDGDGTFTDISASAGIDTELGGCVVGFSDFNEDGLQDLLMGNCANLDTSGPQALPIPGPWEMWENQGDLTFVDVAGQAGLGARDGFPMAVTLGDYDRNGTLDIFSTGMGPQNPFAPGLPGEHVMFQNNGDGTYTDATYPSGLGNWEWGWGASFADFDNDGDEDLVNVGSVAIGAFLFLGDLASPGRVHDNDGQGFLEAALDFGLENESTSGLAVADYDGDGFSDIVIVKTAFETQTPDGAISGNGRPVLMRNRGNGNKAVTVRLVGTQSNAMGVGARVTSWSSLGSQVREVTAGTSFASTNSPWPTFGLGKDYCTLLFVQWPSGLTELFFGYASGDVQTLEEGTGIAL